MGTYIGIGAGKYDSKESRSKCALVQTKNHSELGKIYRSSVFVYQVNRTKDDFIF